MFIDPNELTEIKVYYRRVGKHYQVVETDDYDKMEEEEKKKYKCLKVKVRELSWGPYNELNEESVSKDASGGRQWNYRLYKENKIRKVLVSWDAQKPNEKGEMVPVPVNSDNISKLAPEIAENILSSYDAIMLISDEEKEEKKEEEKK